MTLDATTASKERSTNGSLSPVGGTRFPFDIGIAENLARFHNHLVGHIAGRYHIVVIPEMLGQMARAAAEVQHFSGWQYKPTQNRAKLVQAPC
jgi:hypothetical protein